MTACDGIDDVVLLDRFRVLHPVDAPGFEPLEACYHRSLAEARDRTRWSRDQDATRASCAVTANDARNAVAEALAAENAVAYIPTDDDQFAELGAPKRHATWIAGGQRADLATIRDAALMGGLVARGASIGCSALADIGDDLALAHGAQVEVLVLRGTLPPGSSLVAGATSLAVVAVDGPLEITDPDGAIRTVDGGNGCRDETTSSLRTSPGGHAIIAVLGEPTNAAIWSFAAQKAGNHPLARTDLPYDLSQPAAVYGRDEPVLLGPVIREVMGEILTDDTAAEAMAAWRANLRPLDRPRPDLLALPYEHQDWPPLTLTGHFPGGVTQLGEAEGDRTWLAAGGYAFRAHVHLVPLFEALLAGTHVPFTRLHIDCPNHDPLCAHRALEQLLWVGLVDAEVIDQP